MKNCLYCIYYRHVNHCTFFNTKAEVARKFKQFCGIQAKYFERRVIDKNELLK